MKMSGEPQMNKMKPTMMDRSEPEEYGDTPLGAICNTLDGLIEKGGASKDELMALKDSVEAVRADVDGEEPVEDEPVNDGKPMKGHKPGEVMIAIGFGKPKGEK